MEAEIIQVEKKLIVGMKIEMSLSENKTKRLWKNFTPKINLIQNRIDSDLISMATYPSSYFQNFTPSRHFTKWAGVEVVGRTTLPDGLEEMEIPAGLYGCFLYKGLPSAAGPFYQSIFQDWLPKSGYQLDSRPHFEVMGEKYKNDDPNSEELVYIPMALR